MTLFRLDASLRQEGSASRALADIVQSEWAAAHPGRPVVRRDLGLDPLPVHTWSRAIAAAAKAPGAWTPEEAAAVDLAARLTDELADADELLFASPMYNFSVSQHLKAYIDVVIADPRMGPGQVPVTAGKSAVLTVVQGGNYSPGTPRAGWDHGTDWLRRIFADVWQLDLQVVVREFTLVGVAPGLDQFTGMAEDLRVHAEQRAGEFGRQLRRTGAAA